MQILAIAAGGALGALMRFWVSSAIYMFTGRAFPWGTLVVNVAGSLLMGFLYILLLERLTVGPEVRALLLIGFLGAVTTFSKPFLILLFSFFFLGFLPGLDGSLFRYSEDILFNNSSVMFP